MWNDLSAEWKKTLEQAWIAFQHGSIPIGAIITDEEGNVLIAGRNETCEAHYPNVLCEKFRYWEVAEIL